ncbi:MAG: hypothetical protein RLZZ450_2963 [Pseudomonadota bacterium]|jgi:hypothetical protein
MRASLHVRAGALLLVAAGCSERAKVPVAQDAGAMVVTRDVEGEPGAVLEPVDPARLRADAEKLVARWLETQNKGDLEGYLSLYDPKHFIGVKRSHRQDKARELRLPGWKRERAGLFALSPAPTVKVERTTVTSWLDVGARLKPGVVEVRFLQRWRGGDYGDHGSKLLKLWRDGQGVLRIVREDMLDSQVGWDDAPSEGTLAAEGFRPPATRDDALALWRALAPTGSNYTKVLAAIPDDPAIRIPMSRALVADGNLACSTFDVDYECGVDVPRFRALDAAATFADPCLRRQLLEWALDVLVAGKTSPTRRELRMLLELPMPVAKRDTQRLPLETSDLPHKVLTLSESGSPKGRVGLLLEAGRRFPEIARTHLTGLGNAELITVYEKLKLPEALQHMDPALDHAYLLRAVAEDEFPTSELGEAPETIRRDIFTKLYPAPSEGTLSESELSILAKLSNDDDCYVGRLADRVLSAHGEQARIENLELMDTRAHALHTLCKLGQSADRLPLAAWVKDAKRYHEHELREDVSEVFQDEDGNMTPTPPENIQREKRVGDKAMPPTIPFSHRHEIACQGDTCEVSSDDGNTSCVYTVGLVQTTLGLRLESMRTKCRSQFYCPC